MHNPQITRPRFPEGYLVDPQSFLPWSHVEQRLIEAKHYWLCTVRPDGRPHAIPRWAVWLDQKIYFDGSPKTFHARNIAQNPNITLHLESGADVVIVEGVAAAAPRPSPSFGKKLAQEFSNKYAELGYAPEPDQWDNGGLFEITLHKVLAWTNFTQDPTRFSLV